MCKSWKKSKPANQNRRHIPAASTSSLPLHGSTCRARRIFVTIELEMICKSANPPIPTCEMQMQKNALTLDVCSKVFQAWRCLGRWLWGNHAPRKWRGPTLITMDPTISHQYPHVQKPGLTLDVFCGRAWRKWGGPTLAPSTQPFSRPAVVVGKGILDNGKPRGLGMAGRAKLHRNGAIATPPGANAEKGAKTWRDGFGETMPLENEGVQNLEHGPAIFYAQWLLWAKQVY